MPQSFSKLAPKIFISYRRADSAGYALNLYEKLSTHFGENRIFMDIDHIEPGADFIQVIEDAVRSCDVLIALISHRCLTISDGTERQLDNPHDLVRLEIAAALNRNVRVLPVLVQGASMPTEQDLPDELKMLSRRQAFDLSDRRWNHDVDQLIGTLKSESVTPPKARLRVVLASAIAVVVIGIIGVAVTKWGHT